MVLFRARPQQEADQQIPVTVVPWCDVQKRPKQFKRFTPRRLWHGRHARSAAEVDRRRGHLAPSIRGDLDRIPIGAAEIDVNRVRGLREADVDLSFRSLEPCLRVEASKSALDRLIVRGLSLGVVEPGDQPLAEGAAVDRVSLAMRFDVEGGVPLLIGAFEEFDVELLYNFQQFGSLGFFGFFFIFNLGGRRIGRFVLGHASRHLARLCARIERGLVSLRLAVYCADERGAAQRARTAVVLLLVVMLTVLTRDLRGFAKRLCRLF
jgi:hypothetical protein